MNTYTFQYNIFLFLNAILQSNFLLTQNSLSDDSYLHGDFAVVEKEDPSDDMSKVWRHYGIKVNATFIYNEGVGGRGTLLKWRTRSLKCEALVKTP